MNEPRRSPERWRQIQTTYPFRSTWLTVRQDTFEDRAGSTFSYTYQDHPGCVLIVALSPEMNVQMLQHFRFPLARWCWELPAGRREASETTLETAKRELFEEIGGSSDQWTSIGGFYSTSGSSNEYAEVFLARNVVKTAHQHEPLELIDIVEMPFQQAVDMAEGGRIDDGPSALALLLARRVVEHPGWVLR